MLPGEGPPLGGGREDSGGASGVHVVRGVADEECAGVGDGELREGVLHGIGVRLVARGVLDGDDGVEPVGDVQVAEGACGHAASLAGDESQRVSLTAGPVEGVADAGVGGGGAFEVAVLVVAIAGDELFDVVGAVAPGGELFAQGGADAGGPFRVGGASRAIGEGVVHAGEEEPDGVDQGAIEIEEEGEPGVGVGHAEA